MSDDAVVWADYHVDEVRKRDKEIAALKEQVADLKARLWLAEAQRDRCRAALADTNVWAIVEDTRLFTHTVQTVLRSARALAGIDGEGGK